MTNTEYIHLAQKVIHSLRMNLRALSKLYLHEFDSRISLSNPVPAQIHELMQLLAKIITQISNLYGGY